MCGILSKIEIRHRPALPSFRKEYFMEEALEKLALEAVESPANQSRSSESFDVIDYVRVFKK